MLSFPSTLNTGGSNIVLPTIPRRTAMDILKNIGHSFVNSATNAAIGGAWAALNGADSTGDKPATDRIPYDVTAAPSLDQKNIFSKVTVGIHPSTSTKALAPSAKYSPMASRGNWFASPTVFSPEIYSLMNTYRYVYSGGVIIPMDGKIYEDDGSVSDEIIGYFDPKMLSPSLFNPYYGIQRIGPTKNTPLTDDNIDKIRGDKVNFSTDFTDCSIATLCKMSAQKTSELGQARYKYSDFMYCKDLGMPNNRMITLRKFSNPVGDIIMGGLATDADNVNSTPGDIGRLVCYFDTEDNKLEDILNYNFKASWKHLESEWKQKESQEDNRQSPLGMLLNTMSSQYRQSYVKSITGQNNLFDYFLGKLDSKNNLGKFGVESSSSWYERYDVARGLNYDQNKVYEPVDTVREMEIYEGKLQFTHEFTLVFNYTLRSYDNINPKAAMLDLLANITSVTYKRGNFWGGRNEILGPRPNVAGWRKANMLIDKTWDKLGGMFESLVDGGFDFSGLMGNISNFLQNGWKTIKDTVSGLVNGTSPSESTKKTIKQFGGALGAMAKAKLKDTLGRPQLYMFNSLLTGDNTGLWHVTIGNPRNPIAVMGNMIVTDAKVTHYGPLGIDDFPTGIKVSVTLKHARPRDMVDIQKMYTRGISAIYVNMNGVNSIKNGKDGTSAIIDTHHKSDTAAGMMYLGDDNLQRIKRNVDEIM